MSTVAATRPVAKEQPPKERLFEPLKIGMQMLQNRVGMAVIS